MPVASPAQAGTIFQVLGQVFGQIGRTVDWKEPTEFTIKPGLHDSIHPLLRRFKNSTITRAISFDQGAIYTSVDPSNQADSNKLFGATDCNEIDPQKASARFGWRWNLVTKQIELLAQVDHQGIHDVQYLGSTEPGQVTVGTITAGKGYYDYTYQGKTTRVTRYCHGHWKGYVEYPYFGGQEVAPTEVHFTLVNPL